MDMTNSNSKNKNNQLVLKLKNSDFLTIVISSWFAKTLINNYSLTLRISMFTEFNMLETVTIKDSARLMQELVCKKLNLKYKHLRDKENLRYLRSLHA